METREAEDSDVTRRRRECLKCKKRFTTYERVEMIELRVVKKNGDIEAFDKWIGRYHANAEPVVLYLFDKPFPTGAVMAYYKKIDQVLKLKAAAMNDDVAMFEKYMKGLPVLTVMGYRNTYKVTIDKADILEATKKTTRQTIQMQSAAKREGVKIAVDYKKQDIYDLWKLLFHQVLIK